MGVLWELERNSGNFRQVSNVYQGSFKGGQRKVLGCFKEVESVFQESFNGVQRKIGGCLN